MARNIDKERWKQNQGDRERVYKYRPWNTNTVNLLINHEDYYSADFNDPFDCRITPRTDGTESHWIDTLEDLTGNRVKAQNLVKTGRRWLR